ncbi:MAG TPA: elongation factor Ts [Candidatus Lambdaproteobacteria bacterium]|nr:elongation factor Ts [Deltaproteobacteria bacterium]HIB46508.1 elongation factor Ts [Candidatus Lambdaproteobacteria bacterium]
MTMITASAVKNLREITGVAMMDCKKALVETNGDLEAAQDFLRKKGQAKALKKASRETREGAVCFSTSADGKSTGLVKVACETDFVARNEKFQAFIKQLANQVCEQGSDDLLAQPLIEGEGNVEGLLTGTIAELGENMQILSSRKMEIVNGVFGGYIHSNGKIGVAVPLETDQPCDDVRLGTLARNIAMHIAAFPSEAVKPDQVSKEVLAKEKEVFTAQARESGKPDNIIEKMIEGRLNKFLKEICVESQPFVKDPQVSVSQLVENTAKELGVKINFNTYEKYQF